MKRSAYISPPPIPLIDGSEQASENEEVAGTDTLVLKVPLRLSDLPERAAPARLPVLQGICHEVGIEMAQAVRGKATTS